MLVALLPDQVDMHWDIIKLGLEKSLPPIALYKDHSMNRVLEALLEGSMVCWLALGDKTIDGFVMTTTTTDFYTNTKSLLIYAIFGEASRHVWADGYFTLYKHAKAQECDFITGYTTQDRLAALGKSFDFIDSITFQHFFSVEVK